MRARCCQYEPIDERLESLPIRILRCVRRFDWVEPRVIADALNIPGDDIDARERNRFDVELGRLFRSGRLERRGERMNYQYRITEQGQQEYAFQLGRNAA